MSCDVGNFECSCCPDNTMYDGKPCQQCAEKDRHIKECFREALKQGDRIADLEIKNNELKAHHARVITELKRRAKKAEPFLYTQLLEGRYQGILLALELLERGC